MSKDKLRNTNYNITMLPKTVHSACGNVGNELAH